ncbi:hypothetical protein B194_3688 [Serratia plymuthica A30]|nr:hypothetical protein B194_3688 [Serratia plymuthica A30]
MKGEFWLTTPTITQTYLPPSPNRTTNSIGINQRQERTPGRTIMMNA